ncbi:MAG: hypothetical protein SFY66_19520 [Oculatellaceae cyanobacterium bins.114]|nr:hypothetical protein [Oculatellaceae cyanobacterium bins.114]
MIKFTAQKEDGGTLYGFGLSEANLNRLQFNDEPIFFDFGYANHPNLFGLIMYCHEYSTPEAIAMARDNEKLLQLIDESQKFLKQKLGEAIVADASTETLSYFMEACRAMEHAGNNLGDRRYYPDSPDVIHAIAREAIAPVEKRIESMIERIEGKLGGDRP